MWPEMHAVRSCKANGRMPTKRHLPCMSNQIEKHDKTNHWPFLKRVSTTNIITMVSY
jgi:hypothetical protein